METWGIWWLLCWLTVPAYVVAQPIVLQLASDFPRWFAGLPLAFMIPSYVLFAIGIFQGGDNNLSWLLLILPSPVALLYVAIVGMFQWAARKQGSSPPQVGR